MGGGRLRGTFEHVIITRLPTAASRRIVLCGSPGVASAARNHGCDCYDGRYLHMLYTYNKRDIEQNMGKDGRGCCGGQPRKVSFFKIFMKKLELL